LPHLLLITFTQTCHTTLIIVNSMSLSLCFAKVRFQGDGPLGGVLAIANGECEARGMVGNPKVRSGPPSLLTHEENRRLEVAECFFFFNLLRLGHLPLITTTTITDQYQISAILIPLQSMLAR
jgi:hypothetical protein